MKTVEVYTDGACSRNPGPGGWAAILIYNGIEKEIYGYELQTTNNRMELMAIIKAIEVLKDSCIVKIYTDSAYAFNAFSKNWVNKWQTNNWITYKKEPVANKDLWQRLIELETKHDLEWHKIKGHSDNEINNRCDKLARKAIKEGGIQLKDSNEIQVKNLCSNQK